MRSKTKLIMAVSILLPLIGLVSDLWSWLGLLVNEQYWYGAEYVDDMFISTWHEILIKGIRTTITWIFVFVAIRMLLKDNLNNGDLLSINQMEKGSKVKVYTCVAFLLINIILLFVQWILLRNDYLCIEDGDRAIEAMFKHGFTYMHYCTIYDLFSLILVIGVFKSVRRNISKL